MDTKRRIKGWLAENTLAALSIAGAFVYGATRISYVGFYGEFGLEPEDVGIGYAGTLARALPGLLIWSAAMAAVLILLLWIAGRTLLRAYLPPNSGAVRQWAFVIPPLVVAVLLVGGPLVAQNRAAAVQRGDELRPPSGVVSWGIWRDPLGFTVREVEIEWVDGETDARAGLGAPLMLLGADSNAYYVYDVQSHNTVRLARGLVIVREEVG